MAVGEFTAMAFSLAHMTDPDRDFDRGEGKGEGKDGGEGKAGEAKGEGAEVMYLPVSSSDERFAFTCEGAREALDRGVKCLNRYAECQKGPGSAMSSSQLAELLVEAGEHLKTALIVSRLKGTGVEDRKVEARALGNLAMVCVKSNDGGEAIARYRRVGRPLCQHAHTLARACAHAHAHTRMHIRACAREQEYPTTPPSRFAHHPTSATAGSAWR